MYHTKITNPKTGKQIAVRVWKITPREITNGLKTGAIKDVKDISWKLLNEPESVQDMKNGMDGENAVHNFALSVFEGALDWSLGLAVVNHIRAYVKEGKFPKPFELAVSRKGDIYIIGASGNIYAY